MTEYSNNDTEWKRFDRKGRVFARKKRIMLVELSAIGNMYILNSEYCKYE